MEVWAKWLTVASYALIVVGLTWGATAIKALERKLKWERSELERIHDAYKDHEERNRALRDSGIRFTTWNDQLYEHQDTQLVALEHVKPSFSGPYVTTVLGAVLGLIGALLM